MHASPFEEYRGRLSRKFEEEGEKEGQEGYKGLERLPSG